MNVIVRTTGGTPSGAEPPTGIDTGTAGSGRPCSGVDVHHRPLISRRLARSRSLSLVAGATGCAVGGADDVGPQAGPVPSTSPARSAASEPPAQVAQRVGSVLPEAPTGSSSRTDTGSAIRTVGTTKNGVLDVPEDIEDAGWWAVGLGSATRSAAPWSRPTWTRARRVLVPSRACSRCGGETEFPSGPPGCGRRSGSVRADSDRRARFGPPAGCTRPTGPRRLTLVTCAGPYDAAARRLPEPRRDRRRTGRRSAGRGRDPRAQGAHRGRGGRGAGRARLPGAQPGRRQGTRRRAVVAPRRPRRTRAAGRRASRGPVCRSARHRRRHGRGADVGAGRDTDLASCG